jgi:hypothetical protein
MGQADAASRDFADALSRLACFGLADAPRSYDLHS